MLQKERRRIAPDVSFGVGRFYLHKISFAGPDNFTVVFHIEPPFFLRG
jgi:hypothetical protein